LDTFGRDTPVKVHIMKKTLLLNGTALAGLLCALSSLPATAQNAAPADNETITLAPVVVTAERRDLMGAAVTSSQGVVVEQELQLTPAYRAGQLLETVPGLVVTTHSGEGKANQYLLRGFNLDHGTDLASFVDGMPVNERTHAHGQGYTDLNYLIPELASGVSYTKGPYYASEGDFASVGSDRISYLHSIDNQISATMGTLGFQRLLTAGHVEAGEGTLLGTMELQHYDGPWTHHDNQRKINTVLRYTNGDDTNGYSLTGMYYRGLWNATTDQPARAMSEAYASSVGATTISRFGSLDSSDGGQSERFSLSGQYHTDVGNNGDHLDANAYVINNKLTLWNDFTHYLEDPVYGDQHAQNEVRLTMGGAVKYELSDMLLGAENDFLFGADTRYDSVHVDLDHTYRRAYLGTMEDDYVKEASGGVYAQATTHWKDWMRSVLGVREDYFSASDKGTNQGNVSQALFQPKASLIFSPSDLYEVYLSIGRGYHSNDVRGATQAGAPLLARSTGSEIGIRATPAQNFTATLTLFQIDFQSELTYNADAGQTEAGPASHRVGAELNLTYMPVEWLEFYGSIAGTHARFKTDDDDGLGHVGKYIADAPAAIGQFGVYLRNLGRWSGGLEFRYLGSHPLVPDNSVRGKGYGEWNLDANYQLDGNWKIGGAIYNLLNTHADAAEYYYGDRISATESVTDPTAGIGDEHIHPLEPISVRFTLTRYL
jgi:outer membrane cobalamin receptor